MKTIKINKLFPINFQSRLGTYFNTAKIILERNLNFIKFLIGVCIAYWLVHLTISSTGANVWEQIVKANRFLLIFSLLFPSTTIYFAVERLKILLDIQNIKMLKWDIAKLTMIANFFSLIMPGAVSGDSIKVIYLARQTEKKAEVLLTVLLDRVIGMLGLMLVAIFFIFYNLPRILELGSKYQYIRSALFVLGFGSILGVILFSLLVSKSYIKTVLTRRLLEWGYSKLPQKIALLLDRLGAAFDLYRNNIRVIYKTVLLSITIHLLTGANLFLVGKCIGESIMQLRDYMLATQVSNLVAMLPLTPGGFGIRDIGAAIILKISGAVPEMAGVIPVIMTLIIIFWRLIGCGIFIFSNLSRKTIV